MASFDIPKVGPPPVIGTYRKLGFAPKQEAVAPAAPEFGPGTEQGFLGDLGAGFQVGVTQIGEMGGQFFRGIGSGFLRAMGADKLADDWDLKSYNESIRTGLSIHDLERDVDIQVTYKTIHVLTTKSADTPQVVFYYYDEQGRPAGGISG